MADAGGSDDYLKDEAAAAAQIAGTYGTSLGEVSGTGTLVLPATVFANYSEANPQAHLLFEASGEGKGQLCITIHKADGEEIGEGPGVWLDLLNVKKMYQRGHAVPDFADNPFSHMDSWNPPAIGNAPYDNGHAFFEPDKEEKKAIVYVHGIKGSRGGSRPSNGWLSPPHGRSSSTKASIADGNPVKVWRSSWERFRAAIRRISTHSAKVRLFAVQPSPSITRRCETT